MFGQAPHAGILSLPLNETLINTLSTEAQLNRVSEYKGKVDVLDDDNSGYVVVRPDLEEVNYDVVGLNVTDNFSVVDDMEVNNDQALTPAEAAEETMDLTDVIVGGDANTSADRAAEDAGVIVGAADEDAGVDDDNHTSSSEESNTPLALVVNDDEDSLTAWFGAIEELPDNVFIDLEYLSNLSLRESVPIAWCVDSRDVSQVQSFVPAFLITVTKNMWEVTDVDDMVLLNLYWRGDKGIENMMGIYIQHPATRFIEYFKQQQPQATLTAANTCAATLSVSPNRMALHKRAAENIPKVATKMKACAIKKSGVNHFDVGNVVKIALADVDKAKTDPQNLTGVIANVNPKTIMAQVAVKLGVLKNWYAYHKLTQVTGRGNNVELLGLNNALVGWSMMATITEREASRDQSMVGSQGKGGVICNCISAFQTKSCSCFKEGRRCSSACH
jgi:hypothetical protein